jgi:hypothetical protein
MGSGTHAVKAAAGEQRPLHTDATIGLNSSQAPVGAEDSARSPFLRRSLVSNQGEEGLEPGSVAIAGIEEDSGGKQSASILASSCLPLAFSCLSCSVSFSSCFVLSSICLIRHSCCILRRS